MMKVGKLKFEKKNDLNIARNPLSDHARGKVNVISEEESYRIKDNLD